MFEHLYRLAPPEPVDGAEEPVRAAPGKRTLTMSLPPGATAQRRITGAASPDRIRAAAARGIATPTAAFPHAAAIQAAFGPAFDLGAIRAHVGGDAAAACDDMH